MGILRSASDCTGLAFGKVTLGDPTFTDEIPPLETEPLMFAWDHPRLPGGVVEDDGNVTLDETDDV